VKGSANSNAMMFCFSDPRQQRIYKNLRELVGPGPAAFFRDVCMLMDKPDILQSTAHLVAHLLREVESALRSVLEPIIEQDDSKFDCLSGEKQEKQQKDSKKQQVRRILRSLGISENSDEAKAWLELVDLSSIAHRRALDPPRSTNEIQELWEKAQTLLSILLPKIRERFLQWFRLIDEMLDKPMLTKEDIKLLRNRIPNNIVIYRYFFDHLENPNCIELLRKGSFFKNPPRAEWNEEKGTVRLPLWPAARYLARMAQYKPKLVAEIIQEMPETDNAFVHCDLIDAMLAMPPEVVASIAEKAPKWAESSYPPVPEKLGRLIVHLAQGGKIDEALELARVLLDVLPDSSKKWYPSYPVHQTRIDLWNYENILKEHFPVLVRTGGLKALELLCDLLEKALRLSQKQVKGGVRAEYSWIWRPTIEHHPQNLGHRLRNLLVSGVRDAAIFLVSEGRASVAQVIEALERRRFKVFRRIELHVLAKFAEQADKVFVQCLTDRDLFDDVDLRYEYVQLLQKGFPYLSLEAQKTILGWIEAGPDIEHFREREELNKGSAPSDKEIKRYREVWQRDWLARIGVDNLPEEWQGRYYQLINTYGEPQHPEFVSYTVSWVGPTSPKTADELKKMSIEEIVKFLITWVPPENPIGEPSPEGLGRVLSAAVADDPDRFASEATRFKGLDPTYVRALLSGLREALEEDKTYEWAPVLELCQWVVDQPSEIPGRRIREWDADPDWCWTRRAIAHLLSTGFEKNSIPIDFRERVWAILEPLTDDSDPTPEEEKRYSGSDVDPAFLSVNTTRGEAMHAVVHYALWIRRHIEKQGNARERLSKGFDEMPEVRKVLETHLDTQSEPSLAIRSVYGRWFPWFALLDANWAKDNVARIFPLEEQNRDYFEAAWNTYLVFNQPYSSVFQLLSRQYRIAVERIDSPRGEERWLADPDKKLAEHLMVYHWRGQLDLTDPLLLTFWRKAPDELRGYAIEFIGRRLKQTEKAIPRIIINRLQRLWEERILRAQEDCTNHQKELSAFGWWFVSNKFDLDWAINQLINVLTLSHRIEPVHMVLEQLTTAADTYPKESVKCLGMIAEGEQEGWNLYANRGHIQRILEKAMQNRNAREAAIRVINYLGSRGFLEFRNLLK